MGSSEPDEAVNEIDGSKGLAASGRHLDEGAGPVISKRFVEISDRLDLRRP